jgi:hypothetical protein
VKTTAVFLGGVTLTGVTSCLAFWSHVPTKREELEMIHTQTPYVMDRVVIRKGIEHNTRTLDVNEHRLREVEKKQICLASELRNRLDWLARLINASDGK